MDLEELFEDNGEIVDLGGIPVLVEPVGAPRIVFYGDERFELKGICKKSPKGADAFVRGEKETIISAGKRLLSIGHHLPLFMIPCITKQCSTLRSVKMFN